MGLILGEGLFKRGTQLSMAFPHGRNFCPEAPTQSLGFGCGQHKGRNWVCSRIFGCAHQHTEILPLHTRYLVK